MELQRTSLYENHLQQKAKMAPFAGFEMPLQYTSPKDETLAVRNKLGMFDVSHMGEFFVEGKGATNFLDFLLTNDFANLGVGKAIYSPLCRENGTMIDDLIAYHISEERILICVNASNTEKDWNWINSHVSQFDCTLTDRSADYSLIALQGPEAESALKSLNLIKAVNLPYYGVAEEQYENQPIITARTGYTGEDGFELFCPHNVISKLWDQLLELGASPCGLVARDVLRLEVCFPLYGNELSDELTPLDSALKWTVKLSKENFSGKNTIETYTPKYRLVKLSIDKGIPREGYPIEDSEGRTIGKVSSGTLSPIINKGIALGLIERAFFPANKKFFIRVRKNLIEANYHKKPFVTGGHK